MAPPQNGYSSTEIDRNGSNWNVEMLVFEERGKPEYPEKNLSKQKREPTTNSTRILYPVRENIPSPVGGPEASALTNAPSLHPKERETFFVKVLQILGQKLLSICCYLLLNKKVNLNLYFVQPQNHNESVYDSSPSFLRPGRLQWT